MIYSMTAFARREIKKDWGDAVWEIRSVIELAIVIC